jgi:hypothetical protein
MATKKMKEHGLNDMDSARIKEKMDSAMQHMPDMH